MVPVQAVLALGFDFFLFLGNVRFLDLDLTLDEAPAAKFAVILALGTRCAATRTIRIILDLCPRDLFLCASQSRFTRKLTKYNDHSDDKQQDRYANE